MVGLALSGGGIRGIAHAGVLKALLDNGIKIDIIGGTSSGALIGVLYAMGYTPDYIYEAFKLYSKEIVGLNNNLIFSGVSSKIFGGEVEIKGLKSGKSLEEAYNKMALRKGYRNVGEILDLPVVITSVDIRNGKEYIFTNSVPNVENVDKYITNIEVGKAVRASSSFPGIFCPCEFEGHSFYDGGILDNVPVEEVRKQGADKVIAVNFKADDVEKSSNIMDLGMRTLDIMGNKISEKNIASSDFLLTVRTDKTGLFDIEKLDSCFKYGYNAVIENLGKIKQVLESN